MKFWGKKKEPVEKPKVLYHPDGIPIGIKPGDPVPRENFGAIWDYVRRHGTYLGDLEPEEHERR